MREIINYVKALAVTSIATRAAGAVALLVMAGAFAFGDGGTLTVTWAPGG